ncbi:MULTISPECIES: YciY family protein [unclassified Serratia (in: enterobacteria)]|uniref:YciY family protein n=1 Tax=unclassified Serratia (in: enterobacteria) TaxID=2647522 RepID=UPI0009078E22|nr:MULTISPECIES: YciY family protein [unclassified Serratia (in: enterobacteria)]
MRRSRNEVGRWRMLRLRQRRRHHWLERQSCNNRHIIRVRSRLDDQHRRALLFVVAYEW